MLDLTEVYIDGSCYTYHKTSHRVPYNAKNYIKGVLFSKFISISTIKIIKIHVKIPILHGKKINILVFSYNLERVKSKSRDFCTSNIRICKKKKKKLLHNQQTKMTKLYFKFFELEAQTKLSELFLLSLWSLNIHVTTMKSTC